MGNVSIKNIRVKSFQNHKIHIEITRAAWAQEFQGHRHEFVRKMREDFPDRNILDLVIKIMGREDLYDVKFQHTY